MKKQNTKGPKLQLATSTIRSISQPTQQELRAVFGGSSGRPTQPPGGG